MKVFKFGGASIKNSGAIRNMCGILLKYKDEPLFIVVSAMGKTTNALEAILHARMRNEDNSILIKELKDFHFDTVSGLFPKGNDEVHKVLEFYFDKMEESLAASDINDYNRYYDQVVSTGEYLSTTIVAAYLNEIGFECQWKDAQELIRTDSGFREGIVNWKSTKQQVKSCWEGSEKKAILTQGFIGSTGNGEPTTLGREGSDYTAAILASSLNAESVTIWKDVPGILNADPKFIPDAVLYSELPYTEASEMTYYGASVIHPKTIKPLANKNIPLYVRGFDHPDEPGTIIHKCKFDNPIPAIINKGNQCLFSFKVLDFTFVNEDNLSKIFHELHDLNIRINMMQNSAISFSVVFDYDPIRVDLLKERLRKDYKFLYNKNLTLITIKNYNKELENKYVGIRKVYLMQRSRKNLRFLISEKNRL